MSEESGPLLIPACRSGLTPQFLLGAQALHADVELSRRSVDGQGRGVYVGQPTSVGVALGVAHVMTGFRYLAADLALCHRLSNVLIRILTL